MGVGREEIRATVLGLLDERAPGRTICPSEAARALWSEEAEWRARMDDVRAEAYALADLGELEVTQRGQVVDGRTARGPIRLRRPGAR